MRCQVRIIRQTLNARITYKFEGASEWFLKGLGRTYSSMGVWCNGVPHASIAPVIMLNSINQNVPCVAYTVIILLSDVVLWSWSLIRNLHGFITYGNSVVIGRCTRPLGCSTTGDNPVWNVPKLFRPRYQTLIKQQETQANYRTTLYLCLSSV